MARSAHAGRKLHDPVCAVLDSSLAADGREADGQQFGSAAKHPNDDNGAGRNVCFEGVNQFTYLAQLANAGDVPMLQAREKPRLEVVSS